VPPPATMQDFLSVVAARAADVPSIPNTQLYDREWAHAQVSVAGRPLRVVQFNLLADGLCGMDKDKGGFTESPTAALDWDYRRQLLVDEIFRHFAPDIVACQEVDHFDWLSAAMEMRGLRGMFLKKPDSVCKKSLDSTLEDGCALFWRPDNVACEHLHTFNYDKLAADGSPTGTKSNQVAIVAEMRLTGQPATGFVVAVSHLMAKKTPEGERGRAQQLAMLIERAQAIAVEASVPSFIKSPCSTKVEYDGWVAQQASAAAGPQAVVIMLDMNAAPGETADCSPEAYPVAIKMGMKSAYKEVLGEEPRWTTWKRRGVKESKHTIDYILITPKVGVGQVLRPPEDADMAPERLPGWRYPSDHVALQAELTIS